MQKISKKIVFIIIVFCIIIANSFCLAENTVTTKGKAKIDNNIESENSINQVTEEKDIETEVDVQKVELSYPDIKEKKTNIGPLTLEEVIALAIAMQSLLGIIIVISLYVRSRRDRYEEEWEEDDYIEEIENKEQEEPKAMKELKEEAASKEPKAIEELEDEKKLEKIRKEREKTVENISQEDKTENGLNDIDKKDEKVVERDNLKEDTMTLNSKHQQALDDFYKYAEEIKKEKKSKRGKGKHSM
ncbi:MAG TPA: hypothetical protein OIM48_07280 [Clostridiaceae bacterium]|jgi:hypothetical protein|nr:hypothetical protein [Clostridiaceae bacterium]